MPVALAGDFNLDLTENSGPPVIESVHFQNPFTHERAHTTRPSFVGRELAIAWILVRGRLHVSDARVHRSVSASDHFPLSFTLKLL
jgi:endonuclease/exonuclease/phosphatase family metal-dependent hydrolase